MPRKTLRQQLEQTQAALVASQDNLAAAMRQIERLRMVDHDKAWLKEVVMRLTSEDLRFFHPHPRQDR